MLIWRSREVDLEWDEIGLVAREMGRFFWCPGRGAVAVYRWAGAFLLCMGLFSQF